MRADTKESLDLYVSHRYQPGGFLIAVLENNLMQAMGRADEENRRDIFEIASYVYNDMPSACHGSPEKVRAWLDSEMVKR